MPRRAAGDDERLAEEIERYREAAELALDQLDACADLLVELRKIPL
jgi:hypothetical protein